MDDVALKLALSVVKAGWDRRLREAAVRAGETRAEVALELWEAMTGDDDMRRLADLVTGMGLRSGPKRYAALCGVVSEALRLGKSDKK